ncbi:MAG: hypothetical protein HWE30_09395 [Methylocystaceae bacterium]|nr:hypothetical protein [Methylocystaceae bacterium]
MNKIPSISYGDVLRHHGLNQVNGVYPLSCNECGVKHPLYLIDLNRKYNYMSSRIYSGIIGMCTLDLK